MTIILTDVNRELGIVTKMHDVDGKVTIEKTYDSQPILEACAAERAATEGQKWGELRKIGSIPMAELATMMRQDGRIDQKRAWAWVKANPAFCTFTKALK
jgi:hypothetical protein